MAKSNSGDEFIYVTYIKTTPEKLWRSLTHPVFTKQYWYGIEIESDWKLGSPVVYRRGGQDLVVGKVLQADFPEILAYTFHEEHGESSSEPPTKVVLTLEQNKNSKVVKLTVVHSHFVENSKHKPSISRGWPEILSSLKSLLETGEALS